MSHDSDDIHARMVEFLPRLRRFGYTLTGNLHDADDLTQAAVERALGHLDQWTPGTRLESWMFRIAKNIWIDQLRTSRHRGMTVDPDEVADLSGEDGRRTTESQLMLRQTQDAVARLPEDQRVVLALVCVDGLPYREAAEVLELPIGTVMSRLARARKALAQMLSLGEEG